MVTYVQIAVVVQLVMVYIYHGIHPVALASPMYVYSGVDDGRPSPAIKPAYDLFFAKNFYSLIRLVIQGYNATYYSIATIQ